jgi:renalase
MPSRFRGGQCGFPAPSAVSRQPVRLAARVVPVACTGRVYPRPGCWQAGGMDPVIVIGAGIAGISCARVLADAGLPVRVLDRAGQPGGRMASEQHAGRPVDTGASYFTVSDDRFGLLVQGWQRRGLARPWTGTFEVYEPRTTRLNTGPLRWAAGAGLRTLVQDLADTAGLSVERAEVDRVGAELAGTGASGLRVDSRRASAVVLAMPDPQARAILHPALAAERAGLSAAFEPVLVLTAGWPERVWRDFDGMFVNGDERLSWIADDGSRRGDGAPVLVAHSTTSWAAGQPQPDLQPVVHQPGSHQPEHAAGSLLQALREVLDIDATPAWTQLHRWPYAKPAAGRAVSFQLWPSRVGACGDGWSERPRVEAAFLSGLLLGQALVSRLDKPLGQAAGRPSSGSEGRGDGPRPELA